MKLNAQFHQLRGAQKFQVSIQLAHPTWDSYSQILYNQDRNVLETGQMIKFLNRLSEKRSGLCSAWWALPDLEFL